MCFSNTPTMCAKQNMTIFEYMLTMTIFGVFNFVHPLIYVGISIETWLDILILSTSSYFYMYTSATTNNEYNSELFGDNNDHNNYNEIVRR